MSNVKGKMCENNLILKEIEEILDKYPDRDAIAYSQLDKAPIILKYRDVGELSEIIQENLDGTFKYCVVGLYMEHNVLIPSIILCLQRNNCPFTFIDTNDNLNDLNVNYIISYNLELNIEGYTLFSSLSVWEDKLFVYKSEHRYVFDYSDINYVIRTSGTTGTRKIVRVEHYCIYSNVNCLRKKLEVTFDDVIYFGTVLTFDPSIIELYLGLTTGSCLLTTCRGIRNQLSSLYKVLFQSNSFRNITVLQMCPSVFTRWNFDEIKFVLNETELRVLILGGENFPSVFERFDECKTRIYNIYGITEISCWAFIDEFKIGDGISLGEPMDDIIYEVKDINGDIVAENGEGELFIGSATRVCYVNTETSKSRPIFRKTGDLVYLENKKIFYRTRTNDIFKRFGKQINSGYIENLIHKETSLENKLIYLESKQKLILFVKLLETNRAVLFRICDKLKVKLLHILDRFSIPDHIEPIVLFPVTKNGKIDKNKLILLAETIVIINFSQTKINAIDAFQYLWKKYLLDSTLNSEYKNFMDLGGTSILRMQFSNEFNELTNFNPPNTFFDYLFTNSYEDVCHFLLNYKFKRKITESNNFEEKRIKVGDINIRVKWVFNLEACVDSTATVLQEKNFVAIGAFSNIFAIIDIENAKEVSKIVLPNSVESSCLTNPSGSFVFVCCYDGCLYCIQSTTGYIKWSFKTGDRIKTKPCFIDGDKLVFGSYDRCFYCVDTNGKLTWKVNLKEVVTANPVLWNQNIFISGIQGSCMLLTKNGKILWKKKLSSPIFSSPCLYKNHITVAEVLGMVHCFKQNGDKVWTITLGGHIYSPITTYDNNIFLTCHDHYVYCLEVNDSVVVKFNVLLDSASCSSVVMYNLERRAYLIVSSNCGYLYVIDYAKECIVNKLKLNGDVYSSPVVYRNHVFIGCRDNNLYCIELECIS